MDAATDRYSTPSPYKISQWLNVSPDTPNSISNSAPLLHYDYDALNTANINPDDASLFSSHTPTSLAWLYGPTMPINHLHDQDSPLLGGLKTPATIPLSSPVSLSRNNTAFYTYTPFQDQDALADFPDWTVDSHVSPVIRDSFLKHLQSVAPNANNDSTPGPSSVSLPLPLPPLFDIKNLTPAPARHLTPLVTPDFALTLSPLTPLTPLSPSLSPPSTPTPTAKPNSNSNSKQHHKAKALYAPANHNHNHKKRKHQVVDSPTPLPKAKALRRRTTPSELITPPSSQHQQQQPQQQPRHQQQQQQQPPLSQQQKPSTSTSTSTSRTRTFTHRTFPPTIPISPSFPLLYRQFHASSFYQLPNGGLLGPPPRHRPPPGTYNPPRTPLDLYTPRYTTGKGPSKNGLCPICIEPPERGGEGRGVWLAMKFSAFNYHMQYGHGISACTALPFSPPTAFRHTTRPTANIAKHEKTVIQEGKCHRCRKWVAVEGVKDLEVKVKELFWWKHAAACHQGSTVPGERDVHVEDDVYRRLMGVGLNEGEAEVEGEGERVRCEVGVCL